MDCDTSVPLTSIGGGDRERLLAARVSALLVDVLNQDGISIERHGKDKYGQSLADIRVDNTSVDDILISEGFAKRWPEGQEFWCE